MEDSTIIKLRQSEASSVDSNGSYSVSLQENILLEQGDIVKIHTAILDSSTESLVEIAEDTTLVMGITKYMRNYNLTGGGTAPAVNYTYTSDPVSDQPDLNIFFTCMLGDNGSDNFLVESITVMARGDRLRSFGNVLLKFDHINGVTGKPDTWQHFMKPLKIIKHLFNAVVIPVGRVVRTKTFVNVNTKKELRDARISNDFNSQIQNSPPAPNLKGFSSVVFGNSGNALAAGKKLVNLYSEDLTILLPKATYTPAEISTIITDKMGQLVQPGTNVGYDINANRYPVDSPMMATVHQQHYKTGILPSGPEFVLMGASIAERLVPDYLLKMTLPTAQNTDLLIGSNENSLNFDTALQKMNFDILHMPIYGGSEAIAVPIIAYPTGNSSGAPAVGGSPAIPASPLPKIPQGNTGGIAFTSLKSFETVSKKPTDFWTTLGFQSMVLQHSHNFDQTFDISGGITVIPLIVTAENGVNITNVYEGLDTIVDKTLSYRLPTVAGAATSQTLPVIANREFDVAEVSEGYYLLDIGFNFPQKMIGGQSTVDDQTTSYNNIQSIITKFYTSGNFLSDDGAGSVIYQHTSEIPQMINNLDVRVLHPDGSVPPSTELGPLNSIFLEITKTVPIPNSAVNGK